jgi:hypothetical protein
MSQAKADVVKALETLMVPALAKSDAHHSMQRLEQVKRILDPDVVFSASPSIPHGGTYRGYDAFFRWASSSVASGTSQVTHRANTSTVARTR